MRMVIDINDKVYGLLKYFEEGLGLTDKKDGNDDDVKTALMRAVIHGVPLPKGHGDLIDRKDLIEDGTSKGFCDWYDEIKMADTIIEAEVNADEEGSESGWNL